MKLDENNYVDLPEDAITKLEAMTNPRTGRKIPMATTSKIRNLLAMTAELYNDVQNSSGELLSNDIKGRINYLKIRMVYEAGREPAVKNLVETAELLQHLDEIRGNRKQFILFSRYMEALVAYHRYYGGKDN